MLIEMCSDKSTWNDQKSAHLSDLSDHWQKSLRVIKHSVQVQVQVLYNKIEHKT